MPARPIRMNDWPIDRLLTIAGLIYGVLSYHGVDVSAIWRRRSLGALRRRGQLLERLHASPSERQTYLTEGVLWCISIGGVAVMFNYLYALPMYGVLAGVARDWIAGGAVYLLALYRLGRVRDATVRYDKVRARLDSDIEKLEAKVKQQA
jgi:hypothetical protein